MNILIPAVATLVIALLVWTFRILREYERGVIFMLGRFWKVKGPGLIIVIPLVQQMVRVDLRTIVMDVPSQDVISRDNVSVHVNAVVYFRVIEPDKAIIQVENFYEATSQLAQTTLRSVLGQHELDEMLAERERATVASQVLLEPQPMELSPEALGIGFLRKLSLETVKPKITGVKGIVPTEVAVYLLNKKRKEIVELEHRRDLTIEIEGDHSMTPGESQIICSE